MVFLKSLFLESVAVLLMLMGTTCSTAFVVGAAPRIVATSSRQHHQQQAHVARGGVSQQRICSKLSEIDEMCIENVAEYCLKAGQAVDATSSGAGCDVEEYEALVNQLQEQRGILAKHVDYLDGLLAKLQAGPGSASDTGVSEESAYIAG
jgi:hypothetical protein